MKSTKRDKTKCWSGNCEGSDASRLIIKESQVPDFHQYKCKVCEKEWFTNTQGTSRRGSKAQMKIFLKRNNDHSTSIETNTASKEITCKRCRQPVAPHAVVKEKNNRKYEMLQYECEPCKKSWYTTMCGKKELSRRDRLVNFLEGLDNNTKNIPARGAVEDDIGRDQKRGASLDHDSPVKKKAAISPPSDLEPTNDIGIESVGLGGVDDESGVDFGLSASTTQMDEDEPEENNNAVCEAVLTNNLSASSAQMDEDEHEENNNAVEAFLKNKANFPQEAAQKFYSYEHQGAGKGVRFIASNAFGDARTKPMNTDDVDYHMLGTALFSQVTRETGNIISAFVNETLNRAKKSGFTAVTPGERYTEVRKHYLEGTKSILGNLPTPAVSEPHENGFVTTEINEIANHISASNHRLQAYRWDVESDWKNAEGMYHSLMLKDVREKIEKLGEKLDGGIPPNLHVHLFYMWSDSFQKAAVAQHKATNIQLFTGYFVPPKGVKDLKVYTKPFALGRKMEEHQDTLVYILEETSKLERIQPRYCGISKKIVPTIFIRLIIQNDYPERVNNTQTLQNGAFSHRWGYLCEFTPDVKSCKKCYEKRLRQVTRQNEHPDPENCDECCDECCDWWSDLNNVKGWFKKPKDYPRKKDSESPRAPDGRDVNREGFLPPLKMSFDFLEQAFRFAVHNSVCKSWTLENCKQYLRTCGFHGKLFESTWEAIMVARRDKLSPDTIHPPPLWCKYKSLGLELHHFVDTPMHMLFLGVMKHLMGNIGRLFHGQRELYAQFSQGINNHLNACNKQSITWCRGLAFSNGDGLGVVAWQSDQFSAFARLSLIYFGYLEEFKDHLDQEGFKALKQTVVMWNMLLSALFCDEEECDPDMVDHYVKLFLSAACNFGEKTTRYALSGSEKKVKGNGNKECFFEGTSNYFSLLNLKDLVSYFGSIRMLWEGEREKYIKYVKGVLTRIQKTDTYLQNQLQKLLSNHCLDHLMVGNQYYDPEPECRTWNYKVYKSIDSFKEDHWDRGILLSGVLLKGAEGIYICVQGKEHGSIDLWKLLFNDDHGRMKFNLYYAPFGLPERDSPYVTVTKREGLNEIIRDNLLIHPMICKTLAFDKVNGHAVVSKSWRVRTRDGSMKRIHLDKETLNSML